MTTAFKFFTDLARFTDAETTALIAAFPFLHDFANFHQFLRSHPSPVRSDRLLLVDSGVYEFKKTGFYTPDPVTRFAIINEHKNDQLWFNVLDFPSDMCNVGNNIELTENEHQRYLHIDQTLIFTVQWTFMDINDFDYQYRRLLDRLAVRNKRQTIIGLGNMCRINSTAFYKQFAKHVSFDNTFRHHIYAPFLRGFQTLIDESNLKIDQLSIDSTKWTRPVNNSLPRHSCRKNERAMFLHAYLQRISSIIEK